MMSGNDDLISVHTGHLIELVYNYNSIEISGSILRCALFGYWIGKHRCNYVYYYYYYHMFPMKNCEPYLGVLSIITSFQPITRGGSEHVTDRQSTPQKLTLQAHTSTIPQVLI